MRWASWVVIAGVSLPSFCWADELNLQAVIQKAVERSYPLKIAALDVQLAKTEVKSAKADYYPTLKASINLEYLKSLDSDARPVTSIGNTVIPAGTRFQNSVGVQFNQTLVDFGVRKHK